MAAGVDVGRGEQRVEQEARAGAALAVDEAQAGPREIGQALHAQRVARRHHQALGAVGDVDHRVLLRIEPARVELPAARLERAVRHVEAGEVARAVVQRGRGVLAVGVDALDVDARAAQHRHQLLDGEAMARVDAQQALRRRDHALQFDLELGGQRVERGREARGDAVVGPHQLLGQRRQPRAATALHAQQRRAEPGFAVADRVPGVPVRQPGALAGGRDAARVGDAGQQLDEARAQRVAAVVGDRPLGTDGDLVHGRSVCTDDRRSARRSNGLVATRRRPRVHEVTGLPGCWPACRAKRRRPAFASRDTVHSRRRRAGSMRAKPRAASTRLRTGRTRPRCMRRDALMPAGVSRELV